MELNVNFERVAIALITAVLGGTQVYNANERSTTCTDVQRLRTDIIEVLAASSNTSPDQVRYEQFLRQAESIINRPACS